MKVIIVILTLLLNAESVSPTVLDVAANAFLQSICTKIAVVDNGLTSAFSDGNISPRTCYMMIETTGSGFDQYTACRSLNPPAGTVARVAWMTTEAISDYTAANTPSTEYWIGAICLSSTPGTADCGDAPGASNTPYFWTVDGTTGIIPLSATYDGRGARDNFNTDDDHGHPHCTYVKTDGQWDERNCGTVQPILCEVRKPECLIADLTITGANNKPIADVTYVLDDGTAKDPVADGEDFLPYLAVATVYCSDGFTLTSNPSASSYEVTCTEFDTWSTFPTPDCSLATTCNSALITVGTNVATPAAAQIAIASTITVECDPGYFVENSGVLSTDTQYTVTCDAANTWNTVENDGRSCEQEATCNSGGANGIELGTRTVPILVPADFDQYTNFTVQCLPTFTLEIDDVLTDLVTYDVTCIASDTWDPATNKGYDCKQNPCLDYCQNGGNCTNEGFQASCTCESGWAGDTCTEDLDECASSPCLNKGLCEQLPFDGYQCVCLVTFTGETCDEQVGTCGLQTSGEKTARASSMTIATISSASVIIGLIFLLILFIILRDLSIARVYHMIQELSLLLAHGMLIWGRTTTVFDTGALCDAENNPDYQAVALSPALCKIVAIVLHYAFLVYFVSLMLEALHNYILYTMVMNKKNLLSRPSLLIAAILIPIAPVLLTAVPLHDYYTNDDTCWLNFGTINAVIELAPICILAALTVIVSEATSMRKFAVNENADLALRTSSITNSRGTLLMAPLGLGAWLTGVLGVYDSSLFFYTLAAALNLALLIVIIMFHTGGNAKARALIKKMCCCCGK